MSKPGVLIYFDLRPCLKRLDMSQKGQLFEAIMDYGELGLVPEFDDLALGIAWDFVKPRIDRDSTSYDRSISQKKYAVYSREAKKRGETPISFDAWLISDHNKGERLVSGDTERYPTSTPTSTPASTPTSTPASTLDNYISGADKPLSRSRFVPPSIEEVKAYCIERGNGVNPQRFVDFYTANGWMRGKNRIKDWKACVRTWENSDNQSGGKQNAVNIPGVREV